MWEDPIVAEVRRIREAYAAKYNNDIGAICRAAREEEQNSGRVLIQPPPKPARRQPAPTDADQVPPPQWTT